MMRLLLYGLIAAALGAGIVLLIAKDSGYILISLGSYTLEMGFWFGLVSLLLVVYLGWKSWRLAVWVWDIAASSLSFISESRSKRIEKRTNRGLIYFVEGNWRAAKKDLLAAAKLQDKPLLQYLAAANSAFELGEADETRFLLQQAEKVAPENELAIMLTQARIEIRDKHYEQALATLKRAHKNHPQDPVVLKLLKRVNLRLNDWQALLDIIPKLAHAKVATKAELSELEVRAYMAQLDVALAKAGEMSATPKDSFTKIWKGLPSTIRKTPSVVVVYVRRLVEKGLYDEAASTLVAGLKNQWDPDLVNLYGSLKVANVREQLVTAEAWLREHPDDADLLRALGNIARANELWGKAKEYFEKSLAITATPKAFADYADLLTSLGDHKQSAENYQKGLSLLNKSG